MKIYEYENYNEYVSEQIRANKKKLNLVWADEKTIDKIANVVKNPKAIICHGTRNAAEQKMFKKKYPNAEIIGTEISDTATQFEMTVQHDFHEQKDEWVEKFDIVYSNAFDHAFDPWKCIKTWSDQLSLEGYMFLELALDPADNKSRSTDPLQIDNEQEIMDLLNHAQLDYCHKFNKVDGKDNCVVYVSKKK